MMFFAAVIPPLILGLALVWLGVRGRRVSDHPMCRRCGFDLFGRPAGSDRCPECGADLTRPRSTLDGIRVRRGGMIAGGVALLALALTLAGGVGYATYLATDVQARKPSWWLVRELDSGDNAVVVTAVRELSSRVAVGKLPQRYIDAAADKLLSIQPVPSAKWDPAFGDFLETARGANKLDDARFHRYAMQAPGFTLAVRPRINRGDPLPFAIREGNARVGSFPSLRVKYKTTNSIDSLPLGNGIGGEATLSQHGGGSTGIQIPLDQIAGQLADGRHEVKVVMDLSFYPANAPPGAEPMMWTKKILTAPLDILPADATTVEIVRDESLRPAIERAIRVEHAQYVPGSAGRFNFMLTVGTVSVDLGFDLFVRASGAEHRVATMAVEAKPNSSSSHSISAPLPNLPGGAVDVILRPSVDAAKHTIDVFGIWDGGEIVVRAVPVKRLTPATAPAAPPAPPAAAAAAATKEAS